MPTVQDRDLHNLAIALDEMTQEQLGLRLGVLVLVDAAGGYHTVSPDTQAQVAQTLRTLLERVETELAAEKSTPS